jgi:hypothetical protein
VLTREQKNETWKPGLRPVEALNERALLGYMDQEAAAKAKKLVQGFDATHHFCSQASDSMWRMPGHTEAMKAVVSCDKPGGAAHTH